MLKTEGPRCCEALPVPLHDGSWVSTATSRPGGGETRTTANGAEKIRAEELHLHRHPSGRRTTLPGTRFAGEMGQIYFLQKICFLISACPPKPRVLPAGPGAAPEAPAHPARCRGWEPRALHRCNAHPKPSPGGGNQLVPGPPGRGPHQGCRARSCRGRKTLRRSPLAPEHPAAPDLGTKSPHGGRGCLVR